jgi:hypothetical protein
MLTDLLAGGTATALRKPVFAVSLGSGGDSGGLGGLAASLGSLVGGSDDPWLRHTLAIEVDCALAPLADRAEIVLAPGADTPAVAIGDSGTIAMGYSDDETVLVFSGTVSEITISGDGSRRLGLGNASEQLARWRGNLSFQQQSSADIVRQLLSEPGIDSGTLDNSGPTLAFYVADDRCSFYQHMARLAQLSGAIVSISPDNKLQLQALAAGSVIQTFNYADDLLQADWQAAEPLTARRWQGEGAAGSNGSEAWSWLLKNADGMASGAAGSAHYYAPLLRAREAVDNAAAADALRNGRRAQLVTVGAPKVVSGCTVAVAASPAGNLDGSAVVTRVRHRCSRRGGFISVLELLEVAGSGGFSAGDLL